jgi:hypothetical protein
MLAALIEGQRKRLRNEAIWRQEELLPMSSIEPADPAPPRVATVQPRPEPQLNLPHLGDIWERMQEEKRSLGALNLNRTGLVVKTGVFGPQGTPLPGAPGVGFGGQPGDDSGADGAASPSIDPGFVVDHQTFAQSIGDGWLTPDELAQVHGVANGVNAYRLGRQSGPIGGEAHQAAAADLSQAADRLASSNLRVAAAVRAYRAVHDGAARRNWGGATAGGPQGGALQSAIYRPDQQRGAASSSADGYDPHSVGTVSPFMLSQQPTAPFGPIRTMNTTALDQAVTKPLPVSIADPDPYLALRLYDEAARNPESFAGMDLAAHKQQLSEDNWNRLSALKPIVASKAQAKTYHQIWNLAHDGLEPFVAPGPGSKLTRADYANAHVWMITKLGEKAQQWTTKYGMPPNEEQLVTMRDGLIPSAPFRLRSPMTAGFDNARDVYVPQAWRNR